MPSLRQLQVAYVPEEDRILLRVSTTARDELRYWLTRRLVMRLLPELVRTLGSRPAGGNQAGPEAAGEVFRFRQEQALAETDLRTAYREGAEHFPLGENPVLVTGIRLRPRPGDRWQLVLLPADGQTTQVVLTEKLVHSLAGLLQQAAAGARWGDAGTPQPHPDAPPEGTTIN